MPRAVGISRRLQFKYGDADFKESLFGAASSGQISKLDRFAVRRVAIGIGPCFLSFPHGDRIQQAPCGDQSFERCQPIFVVARAVIGLMRR